MRTPTSLLAVLIVLAIPLAAQAQKHRGMGGYRIPPPKIVKMKPQKITPNDPALAAAREKSFNKLKADLDALAPKTTVTKEQRAELQKDLLAVVDGSNKPAPASVQRLSTDLADTLVKRNRPAIDTAQLARDLKTVMNSAYATTLDVGKAIKDVPPRLQASGLAETDAQIIAKDLRAISTAAAAAGQAGMIR